MPDGSLSPIAELGALTAAQRFRPLLLRCLSRLASQGWCFRPDDGLDLTIDFFLTEWEGMAQRYSADKGSVEAYVATAFVYYAKRRWADMRRWSSALRDSSRLAEIPSLVGDQFAESDRQLVGRALADLPPPLRKALLAYLTASGRHEREVAKHLNITRHRLRSRVADAFGRVAVALGATDELSSKDREIALLLWRDGLDVARVARRFGVSAAQVQETRARVLKRLRGALF